MIPAEKALPRLYMVSDGQEHFGRKQYLPELVRRVTSYIPVIVQLREKHLTAKALYELSLKINGHIHDKRSLLIINERFDIALATGADGVHIPESGCPLDRVIAGFQGLVTGKSTHSLQAALSAEASGADYLIFGPIFETPEKIPYGPPMGLNKLAEVCANTSIPVYAIGGISPEKTRQCIENGAYGVAAMSIFHASDSLNNTLERFQKALGQ